MALLKVPINLWVLGHPNPTRRWICQKGLWRLLRNCIFVLWLPSRFPWFVPRPLFRSTTFWMCSRTVGILRDRQCSWSRPGWICRPSRWSRRTWSRRSPWEAEGAADGRDHVEDVGLELQVDLSDDGRVEEKVDDGDVLFEAFFGEVSVICHVIGQHQQILAQFIY